MRRSRSSESGGWAGVSVAFMQGLRLRGGGRRTEAQMRGVRQGAPGVRAERGERGADKRAKRLAAGPRGPEGIVLCCHDRAARHARMSRGGASQGARRQFSGRRSGRPRNMINDSRRGVWAAFMRGAKRCGRWCSTAKIHGCVKSSCPIRSRARASC
ncbi:hypothetical protein PUN4_840013 [Paraburkholderia unamae]|nr:hypothetical protein PUN4_840013 [Paraburkholderia unamae]